MAAELPGPIVAFAEEELGLTLYPGQAEVLNRFQRENFSEGVWQCGRRSGKSLMADVVALYDATIREEKLRARLRPGEPRISAIIAPRIDLAADHIRNCLNLIDRSQHLGPLVATANSERIEFRSGAVIRAYPCSARAIRGGAFSSVILDEFGHFELTEHSNSAGDQVLSAVSPARAQFGHDGWLIAISTPLWREGAFFRMVEQAQSGRFPHMMWVHRPTQQMNAAITTRFLESERLKSPDDFAREYLAEFVDGVSSYLAAADVVGCKRERGVLAPEAGVKYVGALDPAFSVDRFAMTVGHRTQENRIIVDGCWTWHRHGYEATLNEVQHVCQAYRLTEVTTDQHAAEPIREGLARRGIVGKYQPWTTESKGTAFARLKLRLNTRGVELPDDANLIEELCGLEAKATPSGFTRIAASPGRHDDRAITVAAVVSQLDRPNEVVVIFADEASHWPTGWSNGSIFPN